MVRVIVRWIKRGNFVGGRKRRVDVVYLLNVVFFIFIDTLV